MSYKVAIRNNLTGEVRVHNDKYEWGESSDFLWTEGNYGCDCNRHLFFERTGGREPDDTEDGCSSWRYTIDYVELEDGTRIKLEDPVPVCACEAPYRQGYECRKDDKGAPTQVCRRDLNAAQSQDSEPE